jgi:hypothetical protein
MRLCSEPSDAGKRLDQLVHERLPQFSRSRIRNGSRGLSSRGDTGRRRHHRKIDPVARSNGRVLIVDRT